MHPSITPPSPSRSTVDIAVGVLLAIRGGTPETAFTEIVYTARAREVNLFALCRALIALAGHTGSSASLPETDIAHQCWGSLFPHAAVWQP